MLSDVVGFLRCPVCGASFETFEGALGCENGHRFDVARQGYVNLLPGDARPGTADTAEMVDARDRFLHSGHYASIASEVASLAERHLKPDVAGCVVDAGAGTGYYLASVLERLPGRVGLALDISKFALRRAARAHDRLGAVVCDIWRPLPVRSAAAAVVLDVFAPRNASEFRRILAPDGVLIVVVPTPRHLRQLVDALGLLKVDERKQERLEETLGDDFEPLETVTHESCLSLDRTAVMTVVGMGPSSWHTDEAALGARVADLPEKVDATLSVTVAAYRPR